MVIEMYIGAAVAVALIACLSIYTGVHIRKNQETNSNGPGIVAGLIMGTLVGGSSTIGTAQLAYHYGMSAWWFTLGAGIACLIQALLYTKPLRKSQCRTLVGMIGQEFGERSGIVASLLNSLGTFINILSQMIAASAVILVIFPHIGSEWPVIISAAVMVLYVAFGGTKGAGMAGILKLCMLYAAMLLCAVAAVKLFGGGTNVISSVRLLSEETGINYFSLLARGAGEDLGACLSLILGVLTTQTYAQALLSAKTTRSAKQGGLIAAILIPPIGICGILVGLYMRNITDPGTFVSKTALTRFVMEQFPPLLAGVILGTLFIASVGTGAGLSLGIATIMRCDVLPHFAKKAVDPKKQWIIIVAVLAFACVLSLGSLGDIILNFAFMSMGLRGTVLFIPLCFALWLPGKINYRFALLSMVISPLVVLAFGTVLSGYTSIDPLFMGVLCSVVIMAVGFAHREHATIQGRRGT